MNEREDEETEGLGGMVNFFVAFHHGLRLLGPRLLLCWKALPPSPLLRTMSVRDCKPILDLHLELALVDVQTVFIRNGF